MKASLEEILAKIPGKDGEQYFYPIRHGSMRVGLYTPRDHDPQQPHEQDEIYIIQSGNGQFELEGKIIPFQTGDVLFVRAGERHVFKSFSPDFKTWVIFWGPKGGEAKP